MSEAVPTTQQDEKAQNAFDVLRQEVVANGNVLAVKMARLREAAGFGRLGKYVIQDIDSKLRSRGLGHTELAVNNQWETVYVYVMGSEVERIINAANEPSDEGAEVIRARTDQNATELLRQVRSLVEGV